MVPLSQPAPKQCFTPRLYIINRCASTHFGEIQLAPSSIGISPLTTTHPPIFQHRSVRTSTWFYPSFILAMVRSPGFGSIRSDYNALLRLAFALASVFFLNQATSYKSPAHSSTGTRSNLEKKIFFLVLPLVDSLRFHVLFHSPFLGSFSPFPHGTFSLSVIQEYLALRGGPR